MTGWVNFIRNCSHNQCAATPAITMAIPAAIVSLYDLNVDIAALLNGFVQVFPRAGATSVQPG